MKTLDNVEVIINVTFDNGTSDNVFRVDIASLVEVIINVTFDINVRSICQTGFPA